MSMPLGTSPIRQDRTADTTAGGISWLSFAQCRERFRSRWPSVFRMPLVRDHYDPLTHAALSARSLLDVGATERVHEAKARTRFPGIDYRSFDIDRTNRHDYHDFRDVDRQFDIVTLIEVIEHLPHKDAVDLLAQCHSLCAPGGWFLASVPNVYTPGIQSEWTHVSSVHYLDLAGLLAWQGFEVMHGARVYHASKRLWLTHARLLHALHRLMAVDYAQSVVMLARKPVNG